MTDGWLQSRRFIRARRSSEAGQSLVELALTLPVLALLLVGAAELASVSYAAIEVSNAAKAAAQYGAQTSATAADTTGMQTAATNDAGNLTGLITTVSKSCVCADGSASTCLNTDCTATSPNAIEQVITVETQATFTPGIRLPVLPTSFTLHGAAVQKVLQ